MPTLLEDQKHTDPHIKRGQCICPCSNCTNKGVCVCTDCTACVKG